MSGFLDRIKQLLKGDDKTSVAESPYADFNKLRLPSDRGQLCNAPFRSIRFEQRGVARTCCFNRQVVLGRYPQQSLSEIWNSEEANNIRQRIKANDLSYGCQLCAKQLDRGEFETVKLRQYDGLKFNENGHPSMLDFSIHNTCNLECVMCHGEFSSSIRKNREKLPEIPLVYDKEFVKQLEEFIPHAEQFVFAGGEPFLIELYYDIWEAINRLNPTNVHIVTNGTILNNRVKNILENGKYHITHSIESLDKTNYERIRKNAGLDRVLENMQYFMEYCKKQGTEYAINLCPIQQNWQEVPGFVSFCNEKKIRIYILSVVYPPTASLMSMPSEKLEEIEALYSTFNFPQGSEVEKHNASNFKDLLSRVKGWKGRAVNKETQSVSSADSVAESDRVDIQKVFDLISNNIQEYGNENSEISEEIISTTLAKLNKLGRHYKGQKVTKGKLMEIESLAGDVMIGAINGSTEKEFDLVVRDYFLD